MCKYWTEEKSKQNMIFRENSEFDTKQGKLREVITALKTILLSPFSTLEECLWE